MDGDKRGGREANEKVAAGVGARRKGGWDRSNRRRGKRPQDLLMDRM